MFRLELLLALGMLAPPPSFAALLLLLRLLLRLPRTVPEVTVVS